MSCTLRAIAPCIVEKPQRCSRDVSAPHAARRPTNSVFLCAARRFATRPFSARSAVSVARPAVRDLKPSPNLTSTFLRAFSASPRLRVEATASPSAAAVHRRTPSGCGSPRVVEEPILAVDSLSSESSRPRCRRPRASETCSRTVLGSVTRLTGWAPRSPPAGSPESAGPAGPDRSGAPRRSPPRRCSAV